MNSRRLLIRLNFRIPSIIELSCASPLLFTLLIITIHRSREARSSNRFAIVSRTYHKSYTSLIFHLSFSLLRAPHQCRNSRLDGCARKLPAASSKTRMFAIRSLRYSTVTFQHSSVKLAAKPYLIHQ